MLASRWFILAVLFAARFALGYQFQSAGSVAPFLIRDLGIGYTQVGLLVGGFILPGIAISLPSGFLGRRFGDKSVVMAGMALMVLGGGIASFAQSYPVILFGHLLAGVGGAILIVLMSKMLADWFADKELFLGNAIFIVGWPVGIAAGQATQSWLAEHQSWQFVFGLSTRARRARAGAGGGVLSSSSRPARRCTGTASAARLAGHQDCLPRGHHLDVPQRRLSGDAQLRPLAPHRAARHADRRRQARS